MNYYLYVINNDLDRLNLMFASQLNFLKHLLFVHLLVIVKKFHIIGMIQQHNLIKIKKIKFLISISKFLINHFLLQVLNFEYVLVLILIVL